MSLIQLGRLTLNLDRVRCIHDFSTQDAGGQVLQGLLRIEFENGHTIDVAQEAASLRAWLATQAIQVEPSPPSV
jgi:hypothetical protein